MHLNWSAIAKCTFTKQWLVYSHLQQNQFTSLKQEAMDCLLLHVILDHQPVTTIRLINGVLLNLRLPRSVIVLYFNGQMSAALRVEFKRGANLQTSPPISFEKNLFSLYRTVK